MRLLVLSKKMLNEERGKKMKKTNKKIMLLGLLSAFSVALCGSALMAGTQASADEVAAITVSQAQTIAMALTLPPEAMTYIAPINVKAVKMIDRVSSIFFIFSSPLA